MANLETRNKAKLLQNIHKLKIEFLKTEKKIPKKLDIKTLPPYS